MKRNQYSVGERVLLSAGLNVERYLGLGWSAPESGHCWTDGLKASISLALEIDSKSDLLLRVECKAFAPTEAINHQRIEVRANSRRIATWTVRGLGWQEATIPIGNITHGKLEIDLQIGQPMSPHQLGFSGDKRQLGLFVTCFEVVKCERIVFDWIGADADPVGKVLFKDGNYFRAIKKSALSHVNKLLEMGIYQELADKALIPHHSFSDVKHSQYATVAMTAGAHWPIFPGCYVFLTLRDAAFVWLQINEYLLLRSSSETFALIDGHYGNFALFGNSRPMWVDTGSIMEIHLNAQDDGDKFNGWFGIDQFVISFVYPLLAFEKFPENSDFVREKMSTSPYGISHADALDIFKKDFGLNYLGLPLAARGARAEALAKIRSLLAQLEFNVAETGWSNYRQSDALESALSGKYLEQGQDPRFRAVLNLIRRSKASTFVDIGANDGLFSVIAARDGLVGVATDIDDIALNRLYAFLAVHPKLQITVQRIPFHSVDHNADLVLALAITHHLYLSQEFSFEQISALLARNTQKTLITEFMPDGLGGTPGYPDPSPNPLPKGYSLPHYLRALKAHFSNVEVIDYDRPNASSRRTLVYCEK